MIREDTEDGRSIARFLVNVLDGELKSFRPHHRMSAARELLDRGFGKSARAKRRLVRPVEDRPHRDPAEERLSNDTAQRPPLPQSLPRTRYGGEGWGEKVVRPDPVKGPPLTPHSSPLTPGREDQGWAASHSWRSQRHPRHPHPHLQPERFEQTVLNLLEGLGYGPARHLGRTGDGGIDGIIDRDALGLDSIYVQAKRWTKLVGEPEVRAFSGSLDPHGATRGLLITTSGFTDTARRTAETISAGNKHIRLVDGEELAHLVNSLDMGFETVTAHRNRKLDEDDPSQHT